MATLAERFADKWAPEPNTGCWLWTGATNGRYGQIHAGGRPGTHQRAHRISWELHHGPIPAGMFVLHKCDTPACVNPDHLFLGTQQDNLSDASNKGRMKGGRGRMKGWRKSTKLTHCKNGHPLSGDNVYQYPNGYTACRVCRRQDRLNYLQRRTK